jgi:hypothetical protein
MIQPVCQQITSLYSYLTRFRRYLGCNAGFLISPGCRVCCHGSGSGGSLGNLCGVN